VIVLTGDLHHSGLGTGNQRHADRSEIEIAATYLRLLEEAGVKVTFFVSGLSFEEDWEYLKPICESPLVEVGGHNYSCFTPVIWHRLWNRATGSYPGPAWYERRDVLRSKSIIRRFTGRNIELWRNHMYLRGPHTDRILSDCGIRACSDGVRADAMGPELSPSGIVRFPLNVIPDHEHLYHAERTPEWVQGRVQRYGWSDDNGSKSYYVEEWTEIVLDCLRSNEERGAISNMLIHPITLYLCDEFKSFGRILEFLASRETVHMSEAIERALPDAWTTPVARKAS
jgi:peptidoglycan/xylan/chitin deacetylase (PgdA/CDA1 family)